MSISLLLYILLFQTTHTQFTEEADPIKFLEMMKPGCMELWTRYHLLPSVAAAQAAHETGWGRSNLAKKANNFFGVKGYYQGRTIRVTTTEYYDHTNPVTITDGFRVYPSATESIIDYGDFLTSRPWYEGAANQRYYRDSIQAIWDGGYATGPTYVESICKLVETWNLANWDQEANPQESSPDQKITDEQRYIDTSEENTTDIPVLVQDQKRKTNHHSKDIFIDLENFDPPEPEIYVSRLRLKQRKQSFIGGSEQPIDLNSESDSGSSSEKPSSSIDISPQKDPKQPFELNHNKQVDSSQTPLDIEDPAVQRLLQEVKLLHKQKEALQRKREHQERLMNPARSQQGLKGLRPHLQIAHIGIKRAQATGAISPRSAASKVKITADRGLPTRRTVQLVETPKPALRLSKLIQRDDDEADGAERKAPSDPLTGTTRVRSLSSPFRLGSVDVFKSALLPSLSKVSRTPAQLFPTTTRSPSENQTTATHSPSSVSSTQSFHSQPPPTALNSRRPPSSSQLPSTHTPSHNNPEVVTRRPPLPVKDLFAACPFIDQEVNKTTLWIGPLNRTLSELQVTDSLRSSFETHLMNIKVINSQSHTNPQKTHTRSQAMKAKLQCTNETAASIVYFNLLAIKAQKAAAETASEACGTDADCLLRSTDQAVASGETIATVVLGALFDIRNPDTCLVGRLTDLLIVGNRLHEDHILLHMPRSLPRLLRNTHRRSHTLLPLPVRSLFRRSHLHSLHRLLLPRRSPLRHLPPN
ncbi:putative Exo-glucosaminidase LytG [Blattamonas nauphoetae]|uniref:Exo-glucosaminidase LytG n=1 Tax=Blattamonas nauphoetae TaxID=2049346 RepID=A0ABQ9WWP9_9EUKA|nr:putative Exo-glucosaminidase LytG [Blattamonas nauphoetae]